MLDGLQADRHLGQQADGLFQRFGLLGVFIDFSFKFLQYDDITASVYLTYTVQMLQYYHIRERMCRRMTIDEVKKLIAKDETRMLELKKTTGELHRGMETACAFLNSDGGWLIFGVAPNLKITGQNVTDATRQEIANSLRKIEPAVDVEVEYIELPDKPDFYVIAIYFDSTNFKNGPYSFDGRAFYKVESTTAVMPRTMYEERLKLSNPRRFSWENMPNPDLRVEDIDAEMVFQTLHDGIGARRIPASNMTLQTPLQVLQKLGVARNDGVLLNAANALFGIDPTMHHIQCKVRLHVLMGRTSLYSETRLCARAICSSNTMPLSTSASSTSTLPGVWTASSVRTR